VGHGEEEDRGCCSSNKSDRSKVEIEEKLRETVVEFFNEDVFVYRLSHDKFLVPGLLPAVKDRQLEVEVPYRCRGIYVYAEEKHYVNDEGVVMQLGEDGWGI